MGGISEGQFALASPVYKFWETRPTCPLVIYAPDSGHQDQDYSKILPLSQSLPLTRTFQSLDCSRGRAPFTQASVVVRIFFVRLVMYAALTQ